MKNIARIIKNLFGKTYTATIVYSGLTFEITVKAHNELRARQELDEIADGGYVIGMSEA